MVKRVLVILMVVLIVFSSTSMAFGEGNEGNAWLLDQKSSAAKWYVSPDGNDNLSCSLPAFPCATIFAALGKAVEGDTIYVAIGTYTSGEGYYLIGIDKGVTISGGWDAAFTTQVGYSTYDGRRLDICLRNFSSVPATVSRFIFENCADESDGAITNEGSLIIQDSIIQNSIPHGIKNSNGEMTIVRSTIRNSTQAYDGGGIHNYRGRITLVDSAVLNNFGWSGGGIYNWEGEFIMINSTVSNNRGSVGGGIFTYMGGEVQIYNSTVTHNFATEQAAGIDASGAFTFTMQNSIVADNLLTTTPVTPSDCKGTVNSEGYNLIGNTTGCNFIQSTGDVLNESPVGIPFMTTYALLPGSPAIDAGNPAGCVDDLGELIIDDQRGSPRPLDGDGDGVAVCDMGSYEFNPDLPPRLFFMPIASRACPVLYQDDFSNPSSGWPVGDSGDVLVGYDSGEYRILVRTPGWFTVVRPGFQAQDYRASVDLRNVTGAMGSYGIVFGLMADWSGWYSLEIYPDGWYGIYRYDEYGGQVLAEAFSPAIKQGTATNQITVERNGALINAYANGTLLTSVQNTYFHGSLYLGLINYAYNLPNVDVRFDNYRVVPLSCQEQDFPLVLSGASIVSQPAVSSQGAGLKFEKHQP